MQQAQGKIERIASQNIETVIAELKSMGELFQKDIQEQLQSGIVDSTTITAFMNLVSFQCVSSCSAVSAAIERFRAVFFFFRGLVGRRPRGFIL